MRELIEVLSGIVVGILTIFTGSMLGLSGLELFSLLVLVALIDYPLKSLIIFLLSRSKTSKTNWEDR